VWRKSDEDGLFAAHRERERERISSGYQLVTYLYLIIAPLPRREERRGNNLNADITQIMSVFFSSTHFALKPYFLLLFLRFPPIAAKKPARRKLIPH